MVLAIPESPDHSPGNANLTRSDRRNRTERKDYPVNIFQHHQQKEGKKQQPAGICRGNEKKNPRVEEHSPLWKIENGRRWVSSLLLLRWPSPLVPVDSGDWSGTIPNRTAPDGRLPDPPASLRYSSICSWWTFSPSLSSSLVNFTLFTDSRIPSDSTKNYTFFNNSSDDARYRTTTQLINQARPTTLYKTQLLQKKTSNLFCPAPLAACLPALLCASWVLCVVPLRLLWYFLLLLLLHYFPLPPKPSAHRLLLTVPLFFSGRIFLSLVFIYPTI